MNLNNLHGGYSGDGGPAVNAMFNAPAGLAYDGAGHLTIADSGNHVLRQIDLATNIITTIAGNHTPGFGGDGGVSHRCNALLSQRGGLRSGRKSRHRRLEKLTACDA